MGRPGQNVCNPGARLRPRPIRLTRNARLIRGKARGYALVFMKPHGTYKLHHRSGSLPDPIEEFAPGEGRVRRVVDSLRAQLSTGDAQHPRIRQIFNDSREIFRLEYQLNDGNVQRTTLLDRDALEDLLESDAVRNALAVDLD